MIEYVCKEHSQLNLMADKIVFFSKSKALRPFTSEMEVKNSTEPYTELNRLYDNGCKDFRKMLSNFHIAKFTFEGKEYNSIEHAYHAEKYRAWGQELETETK
jgi:hypothetical protein